jgi:hypothetical protein
VTIDEKDKALRAIVAGMRVAARIGTEEMDKLSYYSARELIEPIFDLGRVAGQNDERRRPRAERRKR